MHYQTHNSKNMVKRCPNCNAIDSLATIVSKACDGNFVIYANGEESGGYLPSVPGLCNSDGLSIEICIACGQLKGLDRVALKKILVIILMTTNIILMTTNKMTSDIDESSFRFYGSDVSVTVL